MRWQGACLATGNGGKASNVVARNKEVEVLAAFVHGALAFGHLLGLVYNMRRRNAFDMAMHGAALAYDTYAVVKHTRRIDG